MTCAICHEEKECVGDPPVCDLCGCTVAMRYMGEFGRMRGELTREKIAGANLADRLTKLAKVNGDRVAGLVSEHQLVTSDMADRISKTRHYLYGLRNWPFKGFVDHAIEILDGSD